MLKLLLVDDEKLERESISHLIDWKANRIELVGAAKNGFEAYDMTMEHQPDVVMTDIKMPIMSGLELIEKIHRQMPEVLFVVLSGYGDYEYTSRAMRLGLKYYLLKPVSEQKILEVLQETQKEMERRCSEREHLLHLENNFSQVLPHVKQQFLREAATVGSYDRKWYAYFRSLFDIAEETFQVVLFSVESKCDFLDIFALQNIAEELLGTACLSTTINNDVILLIGKAPTPDVLQRAQKVRQNYIRYFGAKLAVAVSDEGRFDQIYEMYHQTIDLIGLRFEKPEGTVLTSATFHSGEPDASPSLTASMEIVCGSLKSGNLNELNNGLNLFFAKLTNDNLSRAQFYCKTLLNAVLDLGGEDARKRCADKIVQMGTVTEKHQLFDLLRVIANEIIVHQQKNPVVDSIVKCVYENISNPDLSLGWISKKVLFMNEDYLGKLFKKEMNDKFTSYVFRIRIELAKKLIENTDNLTMGEISRLVGFQEDGQYFCRAFKNAMHMTPKEYQKRFHR